MHLYGEAGGNMVEIVLDFLACLIATWLDFWFISIFLQRKYQAITVNLCVIVVGSIFIQTINIFRMPLLNTSAALAMCLFMAFFLFEGRPAIRAILGALDLAIAVACEFLVSGLTAVLLKNNFASVTSTTLSSVVFSYLSIAIFCAIIVIARQILAMRKKQVWGYRFTPNPYVICLPIFSVCIFYYILYSSAITQHSSKLEALNIVLIIIVLMINIILILADNQTRREYELNSQKIEMAYQTAMSEKLIEQQAKSIEKLEAFAHDYSKQLRAMQGVVNRVCGNNEVLNRYFTEALGSANFAMPKYQFSSIALTAIINDYAEQCMSMGITFTPEIQYSDIDFIAFPDICTIFTNAMDNALRAASEIQDKSITKYMRVSVYKKNRMLFLEFVNSMDGNINSENGEYFTTKLQAAIHGVGIKNIKRVVEKYNGSSLAKHKGTEFYVDINIPITQPEISTT